MKQVCQIRWCELYFEFIGKLWSMIDWTSSIYLCVWLKDTASSCFYPVNSFWTNFASYKYTNNFANKRAQSIRNTKELLEDLVLKDYTYIVYKKLLRNEILLNFSYEVIDTISFYCT
jgi:hypothetical protein